MILYLKESNPSHSFVARNFKSVETETTEVIERVCYILLTWLHLFLLLLKATIKKGVQHGIMSPLNCIPALSSLDFTILAAMNHPQISLPTTC